MKILAIDPGPIESAYVIWDGKKITQKGKLENYTLLSELRLSWLLDSKGFDYDESVIEMIASYGMPVGQEVFDTCIWIGRFYDCFESNNKPIKLIKRKEIKLYHCGSMKAKDANIRQALIDRFEQTISGKERPKGILKGVSKDEWAALALAVYYFDLINHNLTI